MKGLQPSIADDQEVASRLVEGIVNRIANGEHLGRVHAEARIAIEAARRACDRATELVVGAQLRLVRDLRHDNPVRRPIPFSLAAVLPADQKLTGRLKETRRLVHLYSGLAAFFDDDLPLATERFRAAEALATDTPGRAPHRGGPCLAFFGAIARLSVTSRGTIPAEVSPSIVDDIETRRALLEQWGATVPGLGGKALLVGAELARARGEHVLAAQLYSRSASAANVSGQLMVESIAWEFSARHHQSQGSVELALEHARRARYCYGVWGAHAKVQRLIVSYRALADVSEGGAGALLHRRQDMENDLHQGMRAVQAFSEEILLEKLVERVLDTMILQADAQYGVLLLMRGGEPIVESIGTLHHGRIVFQTMASAPTDAILPLAILNKTIRSRRLVAFVDAGQALASSRMVGRAARPVRAAMCFPLMRQGTMVGVLYLENNRRTEAFSADRAALLEMLAQHAANSIVTARLYRELVDENERRAETEAALVKARADLARTSHLTAMGGMAASIAHEINQPLAAIINCSGAGRRWLARSVPDVTEAVAAFDQINSAAARTSEIIRALRALAKQTPASLAPLAIDEVLISVLELMRAEIDDRRVRLSMSLSASGKAVFGDGVQLQQVVLNLITNALEAMTETPAPARKLAVSSQVEGGYVCVKVSDSGTGMDDTTLENIFDPFFTTKSTGIGMGLAICRSIMEAHGGTLEASSEPGHGSTLTFSIPVAARI